MTPNLDDQAWEEKVNRAIDHFDIWQKYVGGFFFSHMEKALWNEDAAKRAGFGRILKRLVDLTVSFPEACEVLLGECHELYGDFYCACQPLMDAIFLKNINPFEPIKLSFKVLSHKTVMNRPDFPELLIYVFGALKTKLGNLETLENQKKEGEGFFYNTALELLQSEAFKSRKDSQELINAVKELHPKLEI